MPKSSALKMLAAATLALRVGAGFAALTGCQSKPLDAESPAPGAGGQTGETPPSVTQQVLDEARISSDADAPDFQRAVGEVDFGAAPVERAALFVELRSPCFPFSNWTELGVPTGQRWPAECDAFDRTVQVTLDDPERAGAVPALELIRAITPFGGPEHLEADVTDIVNGLPGKHRLAVHIDTFSDAAGLVSGSAGQWFVSATLELWPGAAARRVLAVLPVVLESQTEPESTPVSFEVPSGVGRGRLEYRATGHGAISVLTASCRGPAEEFCRRDHDLYLDGEPLENLRPWRDDCETLCTVTANPDGVGPMEYCAENPCGDPNSVRAPRANWCPGSSTPPFVIETRALAEAGKHVLTRNILGLVPGGKWTVSATYLAFE